LLSKALVDLVQVVGTVVAWFSTPKEIEIRTVEYQQFGHISVPPFSFA
jgi:hypothetical protein